MSDWTVNVALDPHSHAPLFIQIARALEQDIRRGRLTPGQRVPGSRALARSLGVHRNTALAAYQELEAQGWLVAHRARGTFVSTELPDASPKAFTQDPPSPLSPQTGFDIDPIAPPPHSEPLPPGTLALAGGQPDLRLVPAEELARAYRRVVRQGGSKLMGYAQPQGHPRLRTALSDMLAATRGLTATPDEILVTRGSQMALYLSARVLVRPGDVVAVEAYGYGPAWSALQLAGATLVPIPVDERGIDVDRLAELAAVTPIRAVYVTPHHQYPTMVVLDAARRLALLELARQHRFAIVEDDYDNEFHYDGRPILPIASADAHGSTIHIGTLSKVLAPGLRIGFVTAPKPVIEAMMALRAHIDRQGNSAVEAAIAELIEDGVAQRHIRRMRRVYKARRNTLVSALREHLPDVLSFTVPPGGLSLWSAVTDGTDVEAWVERGERAGVRFAAGGRFSFDKTPLPFVRLGFAALTEQEIKTAVGLMAGVHSTSQ